MATITNHMREVSDPERKALAAQLHAAGQIEAAETRVWAWQMVTIGLMVLVLCALGIVFYLSTRSHIQPHVVVIDPEGTVLWHGPPGAYQLEDLWVSTQLQAWIKQVRSRRDDLVVMREDRDAALAMTDGQALQALQAYFKATDPMESQQMMNRMRVQVGPFQWKRRSSTEYDVDWWETWTPTYGHGAKRMRVSGVFVIELRHRTGPFGMVQITAADMNRSPLGIYVVNFALIEEWEGES